MHPLSTSLARLPPSSLLVSRVHILSTHHNSPVRFLFFISLTTWACHICIWRVLFFINLTTWTCHICIWRVLFFIKLTTWACHIGIWRECGLRQCHNRPLVLSCSSASVTSMSAICGVPQGSYYSTLVSIYAFRP